MTKTHFCALTKFIKYALNNSSVGDSVIMCLDVHLLYIILYFTLCFIGSSVSLRSQKRASQHLVWPAWSSTASENKRYLTSQTSCSSSRMWNTGRSAGCGSVHCFEEKNKITTATTTLNFSKHWSTTLKFHLWNSFQLTLLVQFMYSFLGMAYKWRTVACVWNEATNRLPVNWTSGEILIKMYSLGVCFSVY